MGTRNLTMVYLNGEYKVAQYGQWDGYPEGQGMTCLKFARTIADKQKREEFADKVAACRWITEQEVDAINAKIKRGELKEWQKVYPELSRDTCSNILQMVMDRPAGMALGNEIDFAADGLFCEWAWLIDLDAGTFEAYEGFNKKPLTEDDRFYFLRDKESDHEFSDENSSKFSYHGVKLAAKWSLDDLPSDEDFIAAFKEEEDE